ncbi:MAG: hypothetical protein ACM3QX_15755 [Syntrophomonadaceae bacterium]
MKRSIIIAALLAFIITGISFPGGLKERKTAVLKRAIKNETVWVLLNHIKPDKRQQFEKFIHEIFWPASRRLSKTDQQLFDQTRVLHPTQKDEDGTYTYVFIMDPVVKGGDYSIEKLLVKEFGKEKGEEYIKMFNECLAAEQTGWVLIQSEF